MTKRIPFSNVARFKPTLHKDTVSDIELRYSSKPALALLSNMVDDIVQTGRDVGGMVAYSEYCFLDARRIAQASPMKVRSLYSYSGSDIFTGHPTCV